MLYLFVLTFLFSWGSLNNSDNRTDTGATIIVFTQASDTLFMMETLPQLKQFAAENNLRFVRKNAAEGVPAAITTTPAIVFQNWRGRSIYANRYTAFSTIENFIRTSRVVPQQLTEDCRQQIAVWKNGRATIAVPIKVTPMEGDIPQGLQQSDFRQELQEVLIKEMPDFQRSPRSCVGKTDRLFYFDLHPYRAANDDFYLGMEIYSPFNCKKPIYSRLTTPLKGTFTDWKTVVTAAATQMTTILQQQLVQSKIGDAIHPISEDVAVKTWENLGLPLPQRTDNQSFENTHTIDMPMQWTYHSSIDKDIPVVQFRFMPPLDRYIGELKTIDGHLNIDTTSQSLEGNFVAAMQSLTMGSVDFDYNVLNKYIKAYKIPESSFSFDIAEALPTLRFGETANVSVEGTFTLMRKKRQVQVRTQLSPILDENSRPLLQVSAAFELNVVDDFGIKGPDGPDPARKMMQFDLNFLMTARK